MQNISKTQAATCHQKMADDLSQLMIKLTYNFNYKVQFVMRLLMDKLLLTGLNLIWVFNSSIGCLNHNHLVCVIAKLPNLDLKSCKNTNGWIFSLPNAYNKVLRALAPSSHYSILIDTPLDSEASWENDLRIAPMDYLLEIWPTWALPKNLTQITVMSRVG